MRRRIPLLKQWAIFYGPLRRLSTRVLPLAVPVERRPLRPTGSRDGRRLRRAPLRTKRAFRESPAPEAGAAPQEPQVYRGRRDRVLLETFGIRRPDVTSTASRKTVARSWSWSLCV